MDKKRKFYYIFSTAVALIYINPIVHAATGAVHSTTHTLCLQYQWVKMHIYIFIIEVEMLMWSLLMIVLNIFVHSSYHDNEQSTSFTTRLEGYDKSLKRGVF